MSKESPPRMRGPFVSVYCIAQSPSHPIPNAIAERSPFTDLVKKGGYFHEPGHTCVHYFGGSDHLADHLL